MSHVTNVIMSFGPVNSDHEKFSIIQDINSFFGEKPGFVDVGPYAGGSKSLECDVLMGAFNYLDQSAFINHTICIQNLWRIENVQIMMMEQDEAYFHSVYPAI